MQKVLRYGSLAPQICVQNLLSDFKVVIFATTALHVIPPCTKRFVIAHCCVVSHYMT